MEIGTTVISTEEYMELRAMRDNLEARKAEIEANADKVFVNEFGTYFASSRYILKDEALKKLTDEATRRDALIDNQKEKISELNRIANSHPKTTISNRLRFLFTGNLEY